jgi:hypothetical protein
MSRELLVLLPLISFGLVRKTRHMLGFPRIFFAVRHMTDRG